MVSDNDQIMVMKTLMIACVTIDVTESRQVVNSVLAVNHICLHNVNALNLKDKRVLQVNLIMKQG